MTEQEQELDRLDKLIFDFFIEWRRQVSKKYESHKELNPDDDKTNYYWLGYLASLQDCINNINKILALIKEAGYVQLADDQNLPEEISHWAWYDGTLEDASRCTVREMFTIRDGEAFRKVKVETECISSRQATCPLLRELSIVNDSL